MKKQINISDITTKSRFVIKVITKNIENDYTLLLYHKKAIEIYEDFEYLILTNDLENKILEENYDWVEDYLEDVTGICRFEEKFYLIKSNRTLSYLDDINSKYDWLFINDVILKNFDKNKVKSNSNLLIKTFKTEGYMSKDEYYFLENAIDIKVLPAQYFWLKSRLRGKFELVFDLTFNNDGFCKVIENNVTEYYIVDYYGNLEKLDSNLDYDAICWIEENLDFDLGYDPLQPKKIKTYDFDE